MKKVWERMVPLKEADRRWDIEFWQSRSFTVRFNVTWNMVKDFWKLKGAKINAGTLRLQRSVENFKQA